jgi:DNA-binding MarR family transcriptional regulator
MQQSAIAKAKDRPDFMVFNEIAIIAQLAENRLERSLPPGMSAAQFGVLNHFSRRGGEETPAQLASAFQVTKGAMTNTLQRLEAQGFVRVVPHGVDGRKKLVSITPEGVSAHGQAILALRPYFASLRDAFTDAEFEAALPFLRAMRAWLDENR